MTNSSERSVRIGIVAPACRLAPETAARVTELADRHFGARVSLVVHPQCHLASGHFAGDDAARASALIEVANDPAIDAIWFARGGYGSVRLLDEVLPKLLVAARRKTYMGYSDLGSLLGALYAVGFSSLVHGPMPADIVREGGDEAVLRALTYLLHRSLDTLEPSVQASGRTVAFNMTILGNLIGTPYMPDLVGHVLMLEEVSEHMYRIDRTMAHITSSPAIRKCAGIRLGRCSLVPPNDPEFGDTEEGVVKDWCRRSAIPYLGRADIGHDSANRVVPFGPLRLA